MTGEEVIKIRQKLGLSRKRLAQLIEAPYETLCRWEKGKRSPSKFYANQLRKLAAKQQPERVAEQWVFTASHMKRIQNAISMTEGTTFGTVHALFDQNRMLFLGRISLLPDAHTVDDLKCYFPKQRLQSDDEQWRIVGLFAAQHKEMPDFGNMWGLMVSNRTFDLGVDHGITYSGEKEKMEIWRLPSHCGLNVRGGVPYRVTYFIVG